MGATDAVMEPIEVFNHLHTYGNHPVSCATGIETIQILKRDKLVENAQAVGNYLLEGCRQ